MLLFNLLLLLVLVLMLAICGVCCMWLRCLLVGVIAFFDSLLCLIETCVFGCCFTLMWFVYGWLVLLSLGLYVC